MEIEFKLAVLDPAVFDELRTRTELAGYRLEPGGTHRLRDRYVDTAGQDLQRLRWTLRLRQLDDRLLFTVKRDHSSEAGLFSRDELELPATPASWARLRADLAGAGVSLGGSDQPRGEPATWLADSGLVVQQDRATVRDVLYAERDGARQAEVALDRTTYHVGLYEIVYREIEVESLIECAEPAVLLGAALQRAYPAQLTPSTQGKVVRGRELALRLS